MRLAVCRQTAKERVRNVFVRTGNRPEFAIVYCPAWAVILILSTWPGRPVCLRFISRAFKTSTGVPPHRYLVQLRIKKARKLLETIDPPISEIAAQVGYDDPSYLARLFRREVGKTPAAYRRERRE